MKALDYERLTTVLFCSDKHFWNGSGSTVYVGRNSDRHSSGQKRLQLSSPAEGSKDWYTRYVSWWFQRKTSASASHVYSQRVAKSRCSTYPTFRAALTGFLVLQSSRTVFVLTLDMNSLYTSGVRQTNSLQADLERLRNGDNSPALLGEYLAEGFSDIRID